MASFGPRRVRWLGRAVVRYVLAPLWQGLVALGTVHIAGEATRATTGEQRLPGAPLAGRSFLDRPPVGHPERLRPELPLSALELAILEDFRAGR